MANNTANVILNQLGGGRFLAMTGASGLVSSATTLHFSLPRNRSKANKAAITLTSDDLYTLELFSIRGFNVKMQATRTRVQADRLRATFTELTGLETAL